jgi:hypothetical protein
MYAPRNVGGLVTSRTALRPQASAAAAAFSLLGLSIDREAFQSALFKLFTGAVTGTPTSFAVSSKLQDSADGSAWADVVASQANPTVTIPDVIAINSNNILEVDLSGLRRFVRMVHTVAFVGGTSPTVLLAEECILGGGVTLATSHA